MYFRESDILLANLPELQDVIKAIDGYLGRLAPGEANRLDPDVLADIAGIQKDQAETVLREYQQLGAATAVNTLVCPHDGGAMRPVEAVPQRPSKEFCDICGEDHSFAPDDVKLRYAFAGTPASSRQPVITGPVEAHAAAAAFPIDDVAAKELSKTMPLLGYVAGKVVDRPMAGKQFLVVLHFLKDLIPFLDACERAGLAPRQTTLLYKEYLYPHRDAIGEYLQGKGYRVAPLDSLAEVLLEAERAAQAHGESVVIIEDGGYLVPAVLQHGVLRSLVLGAVEQTTRGIRNDQSVGPLEFPVLSVAEAELKNTHEPPHVADAVIRNLRRLLPNMDFAGQPAGVIGYGTIGRLVAQRLRDDQKMIVHVYDPEPSRRLEARQHGLGSSDSLQEAVSGKTIVIGCSGETSVDRAALLSLTHGTYLVSASSDRREIAVEELEALSCERRDLLSDGKRVGTTFVLRRSDGQVHLVADGYPINFWAEESMPNQVSDLIMTLIFIAAIEVCNCGRSLGTGITAKKVNELATASDVARVYYEMHYRRHGR